MIPNEKGGTVAGLGTLKGDEERDLHRVFLTLQFSRDSLPRDLGISRHQSPKKGERKYGQGKTGLVQKSNPKRVCP